MIINSEIQLYSSLPKLIESVAQTQPEAMAILAANRAALTYITLCDRIHYVLTKLNSIGIGRNDRVAIVLPNGPEMAVAFLAVAAAATCAPLNPNYRGPEFEFYLSDLNAKALIIQAGMDSPAREIAQARAIPILELSPILDSPAGSFSLTGGETNHSVNCGFALPDDIALVLHTSGTTSRPKIVPLTHINLCTSAANIRKTLALTENDRCLNIMPLFHIHGLMGALLSSMSAGASVVCTPGFDAPKFFNLLAEFKPTWYSAVPTMHQAILARSQGNKEIIANSSIHFIRSSSASLAPQVMADLEQVFNAPVIEAYGMTEAAHQMASNPLPPQVRKPASVGMAAGPEIAIMDEEGNLLPSGNTGEVVIRGGNVTPGYENNPQANEGAFTNGWFRTGDLGYLDEDNYLFLKGRIKEIINRGGEKISPIEVDTVLMELPEVFQAVTFAVPHPTLGEDVAAAVVLRENMSLDEEAIRKFLFERLADFKVPSQVVIIDAIPKGPTGKLQRIGLAEKLVQQLRSPAMAPRNDIEEVIANIFAEVLKIPLPSIYDNFFALGGDSLLAVKLFAQIQKQLDKDLPLATLFESPTIEELANIIRQKEWVTPRSSLVAVKSSGSKKPFFFHGGAADALSWAGFAKLLDKEQPFYALQRPDLDGKEITENSVEELAELCLIEIQRIQPKGPYSLGGHCFGGVVAFEMAQQLISQGEQVDLLALFDAYPPRQSQPQIKRNSLAFRLRANFHKFDYWLYKTYYYHGQKLFSGGLLKTFEYIQEKLKQKTSAKQKSQIVHQQLNSQVSPEQKTADTLPHELRYLRAEEVNREASINYNPQVYPGKITLLKAKKQFAQWYLGEFMGWDKLTSQCVDKYEIPGLAGNLFNQASAPLLAEQLQVCLDGVATDRIKFDR